MVLLILPLHSLRALQPLRKRRPRRRRRLWRRRPALLPTRAARPAGTAFAALPLLGGLALQLLLDLFEQAHDRLHLLERLRAAPHQHAVDVPVAVGERALVHVVHRFAEDQRAADERASDERLAADVHRLVAKRLVLVRGQERHGGGPPGGWSG